MSDAQALSAPDSVDAPGPIEMPSPIAAPTTPAAPVLRALAPVTLAMTALASIIFVAGAVTMPAGSTDQLNSTVAAVLLTVGMLGLAIAGMALARQRPRSTIAWLMLGAALAWVLGNTSIVVAWWLLDRGSVLAPFAGTPSGGARSPTAQRRCSAVCSWCCRCWCSSRPRPRRALAPRGHSRARRPALGRDGGDRRRDGCSAGDPERGRGGAPGGGRAAPAHRHRDGGAA